MSPSTPPAPQQTVTLDQSELLVLKQLASTLLTVEFPGSQLEELPRARASTGFNTVPILTPSPAAVGGSGSRPTDCFNTSTIVDTFNKPVIVDHSADGMDKSVTGAFTKTTIKDSSVNHHSFNHNVTTGYGHSTIHPI